MTDPTQLASDACCPKCDNRQGFVFGTCTDCGWNRLDNTYHFIEVWRPENHLPADLATVLIARHDNAIAERRALRRTQ